MNKSVSPSRRYVAMCSKSNFDGYYFKSFTLPEQDPWAMAGQDAPLENTSSVASWYFLNRLDAVACIDGCVAEEDFKAQEVKPCWDSAVAASAREVRG
jgi:hypothetical protein